jgi:hypothetical protein
VAVARLVRLPTKLFRQVLRHAPFARQVRILFYVVHVRRLISMFRLHVPDGFGSHPVSSRAIFFVSCFMHGHDCRIVVRSCLSVSPGLSAWSIWQLQRAHHIKLHRRVSRGLLLPSCFHKRRDQCLWWRVRVLPRRKCRPGCSVGWQLQRTRERRPFSPLRHCCLQAWIILPRRHRSCLRTGHVQLRLVVEGLPIMSSRPFFLFIR